MRDWVILFIHFLTTLARVLGPGGVPFRSGGVTSG
jgi:hypothetical protein